PDASSGFWSGGLYAKGPGSTHGGGAEAATGVVTPDAALAAADALDAAGLAATVIVLPSCLPYLAATLSCDLHSRYASAFACHAAFAAVSAAFAFAASSGGGSFADAPIAMPIAARADGI